MLASIFGGLVRRLLGSSDDGSKDGLGAFSDAAKNSSSPLLMLGGIIL